jgi:hypothetical protein
MMLRCIVGCCGLWSVICKELLRVYVCGVEDEWKGEAMCWCGAAASLHRIRSGFCVFPSKERERERNRAANTVRMKGEQVRPCRALRLHFHQTTGRPIRSKQVFARVKSP